MPLNPWPRRIFILIVIVLLIPVGLVLLSVTVATLAYQKHEVQAESQPQVADEMLPLAASTSNLTLKAHLDVGAVELLAVSIHPSQGEWWAPDGTPLADVEFETRGATFGHIEGNREYEFVFRLNDLPESSTGINWKIPGTSGWAGGDVVGLGGRSLADYQTIATAIQEDVRTTDIQVGIAAGGWRELYTHNGTGFSSTAFDHGGMNVKLSWTGTTRGIEGGLVQSVTHNLNRSKHELRIVAIGTNGTEHHSGNHGQFGNSITANFLGVEFDDVKGFRLEMRDYEWIEFPDVALAPNQ